ncbi:hypothetical protein IQ250_03160 [Pseudanabaenaceae cyanobacterium LEGE 13415]|nr:hypothetical protein [Pseudanabaenaceae cyanobacterium LEGE 13415]
MHNDLWQITDTHWQPRFIHCNSLMLGYVAWNGYLQQGQGLLVCDVIDPILPTINWSTDSIAFDQFFLAQARTAPYLRSLKLESTVIDAVGHAIVTYDPTQAIVLLIHGNQEPEINLLQNLAISPSDCYDQVQRRWAEFQPSFTPHRRHS